MIIYTKHATDKFIEVKRLGWTINRLQIKKVLQKPRWVGTSKHGQKTAMSLIDQNHILRIVFNIEGDIIKVVTFHIARKGRYEGILR